MSTVENITPVTEEKNNLKEVVEKKTVVENVDKDEPETKKQRLSDKHDEIKDTEEEKAQNGDEAEDEAEEPKEHDEEAEDKEDGVESPEKTKEEILKEKDCNGSAAQVTENGDSAEKEKVNA